ncbi:MAG TPA: 3-deoxy-D-manno-octulosonic acid transferase [Phycisphaerales bacterium]|nr:3-deoxy-D-manno-octulosonic acid transferase [Phycisphaerales bacterium]
MRFLLDIAYLFAVLAYAPVMLYRMVACGRYRTGWPHRFGKVGRRHSGGRCIWIHAVSLGEINATRTVVAELKQRLGDCEIVISTTTDTGMERARALFAADHEVFYFPLDFSFISRRAFRRLRPDLCLLMELEVWPNFLTSARKFGAHVVIVNGRISEHSFKWYRRIRPIAKAIFSRLSIILTQTELYAERFRRIGCASERVVVTGSLKYDTAQIADRVHGADTLAAQLGITAEQRLLVAGATGNDEEKILLDVYRRLIEEPQFRDVRLVVVPRKPERFDEVARQIQQAGFDLVRYSQVKEHKSARAQEHESTRAQEAGDEGRGTRDEGGSLSRSEGLDRPALAFGKGRHPDEIPGANDETRNTQYELQRGLVHGQDAHAMQGRDAPATGDERRDTKYGVILGDTMGDLRKFYSLASVIFVGRSLVPMGGSDMMEAAALGRPTVFGPHATNFRQTVEALLAEDGAICVRNTEDLLAALRRCLGDPDYAAGIARNGRAVIRSNQGATRKTVDAIAALLNPPDESDESHRSGGA